MKQGFADSLAIIIASRINRNATCKVKLEIDVDPPPDAQFDVKYIDDPVPFSIRCCSGPSLFAEKIDALIYRGRQNRVKGRDWYDFAFFIRRKIPLLLQHFEARIRQRGAYTRQTPLRHEECVKMIADRIKTVDFEAAKADVIAFLPHPRDLDVWSREYFYHVLRNLRFLPEHTGENNFSL